MNFINFYGKIYPDILLTLQNKHQELEKEKQAIKFLRSRKIKEAEDIYRILISKGSKNHIVFGNLAAIYLMKGDSKQSIILLKKALKIVKGKKNISKIHANFTIPLPPKNSILLSKRLEGGVNVDMGPYAADIHRKFFNSKIIKKKILIKHNKKKLPTKFKTLALLLPTPLIAALVMTSTFSADNSLTIDARAIGVLAAGIALWKKLPFFIVVLIAAVATSLFRLLFS